MLTEGTADSLRFFMGLQQNCKRLPRDGSVLLLTSWQALPAAIHGPARWFRPALHDRGSAQGGEPGHPHTHLMSACCEPETGLFFTVN